MNQTFFVQTNGRGLYELTRQVQHAVRLSNIRSGLCNVFVHHTSASLIINENADPDVQTDLDAFLARLVPDGDALYEHTAEGPDDMAAHVRSVLTATSVGVPIEDGRCALGTWQGIYLWEHRLAAHRRKITVTAIGTP